ncbi:arginase family protein [Kribbella deserti]|uniref:Arginase family protein n=1 Tax=Kribbella deserti TaxID=1926257 RepID=A0ABV6QWN4_9ACTN
MREVVVVDAPTNLGLRPPADGVVPGCYKLAGALRDRGLVGRIGATDGGYVVPPRYDRAGWRPGDGVFNAAAIAAYSRKVAERLQPILADGKFPVVLGGECSLLLGPTLALKRRGRFGVAYLDGHSDFRHTGNSPYVGAAGGEALALVTGRGQADLVDLDGLAPYVRDNDAVSLGIRADDEDHDEMVAAGILVRSAQTIAADPAKAAAEALARLESLDGFWVHLDVDILDASVMPAVDSPDPGGIDHDELIALLQPLIRSPKCAGIDIGIFDPDLDPDGTLAAELTTTLVAALT